MAGDTVTITSESWWGREVNAPTLVELGVKLREHYHLTAGAIGIKGNAAHTQGYHRSANWVRNSAYCTNRTYSVTETTGNRTPANADWCCALDLTLPHDDLLAACQRLDEAVRAGRLEKVTEWYGNDDGDSRVDGYDNIRNVVASSDSSHLWHLHLSFDRKRVAEDHTDVFEILTGADMATAEEIATETLTLDGVIDNPNWRADYATNKKIQLANAVEIAMNEGHNANVRSAEAVALAKAVKTDTADLVADVASLTAKVDQILAALAGGTLPPNVTTTSGKGTFTFELDPPAP